MSPWSETDFQRIALSTKLTERTLAACRDVLVDGAPGVEAASRWQLFPAQISRAVGVLKNKQSQLLESATTLQNDSNLLRHTVTLISKSMFGEKFNVVNAAPGQAYEGPVVINSHGFLVQKVRTHGVIHDLGAFEKAPTLNIPLSIDYSNENTRPVVTDISASFVDLHADVRGRRAEDRGR